MAEPSENRLAALADAVTSQRETFLSAIAAVRPRLHRYCSKMMGSRLDGEDVVQDALAHAFFRLSSLRDEDRMEAWLFRIAHNKALDHLRRRGDLQSETLGEGEDDVALARGATVDRLEVADALLELVTHLPAKERACVILKDVLDYPLADVADIVDSSVGGVKAALHRGRSKLRRGPAAEPARPLDERGRALVAAYVSSFNRRDWDAVRALLRADARLEVVDRALVVGRDGIASGYFGNYHRLPWRWALRPSRVDGAELLVHWREGASGWAPHAPVLLSVEADRIAAIQDYVHVDYLLAGADVETLTNPH